MRGRRVETQVSCGETSCTLPHPWVPHTPKWNGYISYKGWLKGLERKYTEYLIINKNGHFYDSYACCKLRSVPRESPELVTNLLLHEFRRQLQQRDHRHGSLKGLIFHSWCATCQKSDLRQNIHHSEPAFPNHEYHMNKTHRRCLIRGQCPPPFPNMANLLKTVLQSPE